MSARGVFTGALTVVATLLLTLVVLEIGLRVYSRIKPNVDIEFYRYARLMKAASPGSGVGFRHTPNASHRFFGVDVDIDARGFRDAEIPESRRPGETRVALLGDSVTFGWGVAYGERFSEILEHEWSRAGAPFELVNTGHGNWGTAQERAALEELLAAEPLDGVLQVWYINDAEPPPAHRDPPWYSRFHVAIFLWAKTDLLQRRLGSRESYVEYYRDLYRPDAPGYDGFVEALEGIGRWTRERGLPWVFVVLPEFHSFDDTFGEVFSRVTALAEAAGATVVDGTGAFGSVDPSSVWVAYNDVHPNAKGHAIIARAIVEAVDPELFRGES